MLIDYFKGKSNDEITNQIIILDKCLKELHQSGFYVVSDLAELSVENDEITMASFKNKIDYIDSGFNENGVKKNILEAAAVGICAYNHFDVLHTSKDFISYLIDNLDAFLLNGNVPKYMKEYYIDVLLRGNVSYINDFLMKYDNGNNKNDVKNRVYTKTTAVGRALSNSDEAAYARVLLLPAIMVLIFVVFIVAYMIFMRNL